MKLWQIVDSIYGTYGERFQTPARRVLENISLAQKIAFGKDCRAFEKKTALSALPKQKAGKEKYLCIFPDDCREMKEISTKEAVYIDSISRTIDTDAPPDTEIIYYRQPEDLTCAGMENLEFAYKHGTYEDRANAFAENDDAKVLIPDEWRWQVLVQPAMALCDTANYGDKTPQMALEQYMKEFWEAMGKRANNREIPLSLGAW